MSFGLLKMAIEDIHEILKDMDNRYYLSEYSKLKLEHLTGIIENKITSEDLPHTHTMNASGDVESPNLG